jgi:WD40 repeat protein
LLFIVLVFNYSEQKLTEMKKFLSVAFAPDGKHFACLNADHLDTIYLCDIVSGTSVQTIEFEEAIHTIGYNIVFSPNSNLLACKLGRDGADDSESKIDVWDIAKRKFVKQLRWRGGFVYDYRFTLDGKFLAVSALDERTILRFCRLDDSLESSWRLDVPDGTLIAFSPDGKLMATATLDCHIFIWDLTTKERLCQLEDGAYSMTFAPDSRSIAFLSNDVWVTIWNFCDPTVDVVQRWHHRRDTIVDENLKQSNIVFSSDGNYMASTVIFSNATHVWHVKSARLIKHLPVPKELMCSAFGRDSSTIYVAAPDRISLRACCLLDRVFIAQRAFALLESAVAPYVTLDIVDFLLAVKTKSFQDESTFGHYKKIQLIERVLKRL